MRTAAGRTETLSAVAPEDLRAAIRALTAVNAAPAP